MRQYIYSLSILLAFSACESSLNEEQATVDLAGVNTTVAELEKRQLSESFKAYWYAGQAEISSYQLEQARYGEIHEGEAVLVYVTEPFAAKKQVKADKHRNSNIDVLKLNSTKKFLTGIYPYSMMSSTFSPLKQKDHAIKSTFSVQEWCGQTYLQLNNREQFELTLHSYFERDADQQIKLEKQALENDVWNTIRINPKELAVGEITMIPNLEYLTLQQKEKKAYAATASLNQEGFMSTYSLHYPKLNRSLRIRFTTQFPHIIESWEETTTSDFGQAGKTLTTKAKRIKSIKIDYWNRHNVSDLVYRDSLGL